MATDTDRSVAITERLQRLKAGLQKPKQSVVHPHSQQQPLGSSNRKTCDKDSADKSLDDLAHTKSFSEDFEQVSNPSKQEVEQGFPGPSSIGEQVKRQVGAGQAEVQDTNYEIVHSPITQYLANPPSTSESSVSNGSTTRGSPCDKGKCSPKVSKSGGTQDLLSTQHLEEELSVLRHKLAEEQENRQDYMAQIRALRGAYTESRDAAESKAEEAESLQRQCDRLQEQLQEATSTSLRKARQEEAKNVASRLDRAERAIEKERALILSLEHQLQESRQREKQNANASESCKILQDRISALENRAKDLAQQLQVEQRKSAAQAVKLDKLQQDNNTLEGMVMKSRSAVNEMEGKLHESLALQQKVQGEALSWQKAFADASAELSELKATQRQLQQPKMQQLSEVQSVATEVQDAVPLGDADPPLASPVLLPADLPLESKSSVSDEAVKQIENAEEPSLSNQSEVLSGKMPVQRGVTDLAEDHTLTENLETSQDHVAADSHFSADGKDRSRALNIPKDFNSKVLGTNESSDSGKPARLGIWAYITGADKAVTASG